VALRLSTAEPEVDVEQELVASMGLHCEATAPRLYTTSELVELLDITRQRLAAWVGAGLIRPAKVEHRVWHFDFRQVATAKSLSDLIRAGVSPVRMRKILERLRSLVSGTQQPLDQLAILERDGELVIRLENGELAGADGQLRLEFEGERQTVTGSMRIAAGPTSAAEWHRQAVEQDAGGFLEDAAESYRQGLRAGGPNASICYDLAHALTRLGQQQAAAERYRQTVELEPGHCDAWNNLGVLLAEMGQHEEACLALRKALAIDPKRADVHYNLADTLDEMGRNFEAAPHWQAYLRAGGQGPWAAHARQRLG
jgi:tetratricopeptide (TPR) repeat protein